MFRSVSIALGFPGGSDSKESACNMGTWLQSLGWKDPLEEGMATHSSILAWKIPMDRGTWLQSMGFQRVGHTERLSTAPSTSKIDIVVFYSVIFNTYMMLSR